MRILLILLCLGFFLSAEQVDVASVKAEEPKDIIENFIRQLKEGRIREAHDVLFDKNSYFIDKPSIMLNVDQGLKELSKKCGRVLDYDVLKIQVITPRFCRFIVLVNYENQPVRYEFFFYKGLESKWGLFSIDFGYEVVEAMRKELTPLPLK